MNTYKSAIIAILVGFLVNAVYCQLDGYVPGQDYPIYDEIPQGLSFTCDQRPPGYYADPQAQCQVWHWCVPNGAQFTFLCPNGTVFNQYVRVCDWWFNVDCPSSPNYYGINEDLYKIPNYNEQYQQQGNYNQQQDQRPQ